MKIIFGSRAETNARQENQIDDYELLFHLINVLTRQVTNLCDKIPTQYSVQLIAVNLVSIVARLVSQQRSRIINVRDKSMQITTLAKLLPHSADNFTYFLEPYFTVSNDINIRRPCSQISLDGQ